MNFKKENNAQGAIEYLLLLAAAIIVVSIVVTFMANSLGPPKEAGDEGIFNYLCVTLDSNTTDCGCYLGVENKGDSSEIVCCAKDKEILRKKWTCE